MLYDKSYNSLYNNYYTTFINGGQTESEAQENAEDEAIQDLVTHQRLLETNSNNSCATLLTAFPDIQDTFMDFHNNMIGRNAALGAMIYDDTTIARNAALNAYNKANSSSNALSERVAVTKSEIETSYVHSLWATSDCWHVNTTIYNHSYSTYYTITNETHTLICKTCNTAISEATHTYGYIDQGASYHKKTCKLCKYSTIENHNPITTDGKTICSNCGRTDIMIDHLTSLPIISETV